MDFGGRVKALREELGMTQEELATQTGYSGKWSINKIESGLSDVSREKIIALAKALRTTPSYLMGWDDESHEPEQPEPNIPVTGNPDRDWVYKKLPDMTDEQVRLMRKFGETIDDELLKE